MLKVDLHKKLSSASGKMILDIQFNCDPGEFLVISGPSGAGKTSILRMIAGLMPPDAGQITFKNDIWFSDSKNLKPQKRDLGLVFQNYSLFPNMTVAQNILYAKPRHIDPSAVSQLLKSLELEGLRDQKPNMLSGGQQQRVAMARTLIQQPSIFLLDEPLSAVDRSLRAKLQSFIKHVHEEHKLTTIMVTHDASDAIKLADRIIEIEDGSIVKEGTPSQVFGNHELSGKFQFIGTVIEIIEDDLVLIASVLVGKQIIKVVISDSQTNNIQAGDEVIVASKAFNPIVKKL